jgi:ribosome recycling factor
MKIFRTIELEKKDKDISNDERKAITNEVEATLLNHMKKIETQLRITNLPRREQ